MTVVVVANATLSQQTAGDQFVSVATRAQLQLGDWLRLECHGALYGRTLPHCMDTAVALQVESVELDERACGSFMCVAFLVV
jgi:hypothetical protein